ncbi:MAG: RtcB family protein [Clostridiaceae bacterium]|nr:RtcB family protein [Clostridiaceae bacterium]
MIKIEGKYNTAIVFTDDIEPTAYDQIKRLCNQEFTSGSVIRVMPDVHAGAGCTIGTTMTIKDKVVPNLVGVDIGCGIETVQIDQDRERINFAGLDHQIRTNIPSGFSIRQNPHSRAGEINLNALRCIKEANLNLRQAERSLGTLGGGNHFIELDVDEADRVYLLVHSGSRNIGLRVAQYYQGAAVHAIASSGNSVPRDLAWCEGRLLDDYLHDMSIIQRFAQLNREIMTEIILGFMGWKVLDRFRTIHNYVDIDSMILRKGAISAGKGERVLIPLNMRDGAWICRGKGNRDWNYSAPHGAGRLFSRTEARQRFSLSEFRETMEGIYTTSVDSETIDEIPLAYKDGADIMRFIEPTVDIELQIKPIYNFKADNEDCDRRWRKNRDRRNRG